MSAQSRSPVGSTVSDRFTAGLAHLDRAQCHQALLFPTCQVVIKHLTVHLRRCSHSSALIKTPSHGFKELRTLLLYFLAQDVLKEPYTCTFSFVSFICGVWRPHRSSTSTWAEVWSWEVDCTHLRAARCLWVRAMERSQADANLSLPQEI